jgi:uncharacterized membrane protein YuzA (DUF378 family)
MRERDPHKGLHVVDLVALILLIVGGLNWGLVGLANYNIVAAIFGFSEPLLRVIYVIVGIAAVYCAVRSPVLAHFQREEPTTTATPPHPAP